MDYRKQHINSQLRAEMPVVASVQVVYTFSTCRLMVNDA